MDLIRINDLTSQLGLSSRTLRYYEEIGLIESIRPPQEKYRYFDEKAVERLTQILVLRKMQIPIKDIVKIFNNPDTTALVDVFVEKMNEIDGEVTALSELKNIIYNFLQKMIDRGIRKISALPLLYEEMDRQLKLREEQKPTGFEKLSEISRRLARPLEPAVIYLSPMRVLSSCLKEAPGFSDVSGFWSFVQAHEIFINEPGGHSQFEFQSDAGDVRILRIDEGFVNDSPYVDYLFEGGLFAAVNVYLEEDLAECFQALISYFDDSQSYEVDYTHEGRLRQEAMLERLLSPDERRELFSLLLPVKKRLAPPEYFGKPEEMNAITLEELERSNPAVWIKTAELSKLTPMNGPHYRLTEEGEAEYISLISTRVLSTNISVKIPFRVDIEFRVGEESGGWGHGRNEGSIRFHHGKDLNRVFGVNMENNPDERLSQEAVSFHQPVFGDYYNFPGRGRINPGEYNRLTWIVGLKHFAVILNGEVRYCGVNFPYMSADLTLQKAQPIIIGSNGSVKKYYRLIQISQLTQVPKNKIEEGALTMRKKQSNNSIPNIHKLITSEYGENYWFNGCARYLMEAAGEFKDEPDFGYWFFAGLTGDVLAQVYSYNEYMGESVTPCMFNSGDQEYFEKIFEKCGYSSSFITAKQLAANREMYLQTLIAYIDKGMPVMALTYGGPPWGVYVGYEEYGKTLLFMTGDQVEPERISIDCIIGASEGAYAAKGWLFLGEKTGNIDVKEAYRNMIFNIPYLFSVKTEACCFGPEAFYAWARGIEEGRMERVTPEEFEDGWSFHVSNICNMATNGSCADIVLARALELNPDMTFLEDIRKLYQRTAAIWNGSSGGNLEEGSDDLEALGGGFNVTLTNLQNTAQRAKIAARLWEAGDCMAQVAEIIAQHMKSRN